MNVPVVTADIAERLDRSEAEYMASDMDALRTEGDNPLGVEVRRFGDAVALMMQELDDWEFNRVLGLRDQDDAEVESILAWYGERDVECNFDVVPMLCSGGLRQSLARRGFYQSGFHSALYAVPRTDSPRPSGGVEVSEAGTGDMDVFADLYMVYMDGLDLASSLRERARANVASRHPLPGWRLYIATVDGTPAAFGALYVSDGVGSLAGAATVPVFRGRGCQTALLHRRIADAASDGCDLIASQATPGSVSQRNMERVGLRVAYTKAVWSRRPG